MKRSFVVWENDFETKGQTSCQVCGLCTGVEQPVRGTTQPMTVRRSRHSDVFPTDKY